MILIHKENNRNPKFAVVLGGEDGIRTYVLFPANAFRAKGASLSGATINLTAKTDHTGVAVFNDVLIGTGYVLTEENVAMRYVLPEAQNIDVKWNEVTGATVKNILKKWRADVFKVDASVMATERSFYLDAPCFRRKVDGEMPRYFLN